jgi:hypothetical protein
LTAKVEGRHDSTKVECGYEIERDRNRGWLRHMMRGDMAEGT